MIPRLLHWVWLGPDPIPTAHRAWIDGWRQRHPAWGARVWSEADLTPLRNQRAFDRASSWAQRADIARYELLQRHGGVYLDTDVECVQAIDPLVVSLEDHGHPAAFVGQERAGLLGNAIFGAAPEHPWMDAVVEALPASIEREFLTLDQTGPGLLTRVTAIRNDVVVLGPEAFYPVTSMGEAQPIGPATYALHHFAKSWLHVENERIIAAASRALAALVPPGTTFTLVGGGLTVELPDRPAVPFIERDGLDMGAPLDDEQATIELARLRGRGIEWVAFLPTAFWWLDFYPGLTEALRSLAIERREDDMIAAFRLPPMASAAPALR